MIAILSFFTLLLVTSTWRLWVTPAPFPQVAWLPAWLADRMAWTEQIVFPTLVVLLLCGVLLPARSRWSARAVLGAAAAMTWLVLMNQHRLQPWAFHFLLSAWTFAMLPRRRALQWLLGLLVGVYLYSAWNKVDHRFLVTTGGLLVRTAWSWVSPSARGIPAEQFSTWAWILPLGEVLLAVTLLIPRTRSFARGLSVVMHGGLLALFGPWGLQQRWGVCIWNLAFLAQALYLSNPQWQEWSGDISFEPDNSHGPSQRWWSESTTREKLVLLPIVAALTMPLLEPWGWWDHWLSWGLYSARAGKVELYVIDSKSEDTADQAESLPDELRLYCEPPMSGTIWRRVALDRWSLETLQAPLYPQPRFQWGVCRAVMRAIPEKGRYVMAIEHEPPDRRSGRSRQQTYIGQEAIEKAASRYWMNTKPRAFALWVSLPSAPKQRP